MAKKLVKLLLKLAIFGKLVQIWMLKVTKNGKKNIEQKLPILATEHTWIFSLGGAWGETNYSAMDSPGGPFLRGDHPRPGNGLGMAWEQS